MDWSPQQTEALTAVSGWRAGDTGKPFYLAGYAGTGKTTLAQHFAEGIDGMVAFAAYTGKASQVLKNKGCLNACTIHRLIYSPMLNKSDRVKKLKRQIKAAEDPMLVKDLEIALRHTQEEPDDNADEGAPAFALQPFWSLSHLRLIILDEVSMIDKQMAEDLQTFGVPILVLGDPGQLPPVKGTGYFTRQVPDFALTEIHRQAQGSPVLDLATKARNGVPLTLGSYGTSEVMATRHMTDQHLLDADIVLTGSNRDRRRLNIQMRKALGRTAKFPVKGDKLIGLTNVHHKGIFNGSTFEALEDAQVLDDNLGVKVKNLDDGREMVLDATTESFEQYEDDQYQDPRSYWDRNNQGLIGMDFAYCLTAHKAQGSQWDNVLIVDDGFCSWKQDGTREKWLYTALTRAAEKVTVAKTQRPVRRQMPFGRFF